MRIKLTKLRDSDTPYKANHIPAGKEVIGYMENPPTVGDCFYVEKDKIGMEYYRTSVVQEVLGPNSFRTFNSIYQWEQVSE